MRISEVEALLAKHSQLFLLFQYKKNVFWNTLRTMEVLTSNLPAPNLSKFCANRSVDAGQLASACAGCWWTGTSLQTPNRSNDVRGIEPGGAVRGILPSATLLLEIREKNTKKKSKW